MKAHASKAEQRVKLWATTFILLLAAGVCTWTISNFSTSTLSSAKADSVVDEVQGTKLVMLYTESNGRGYLITGSDGYLAAYHSGTDRANTQLLRLSELTTSTAESPIVADIAQTVTARLAELSRMVDSYQRVGLAQTQALMLNSSNKGRTLMDDFRQKCDDLITIEQQRSHALTVQSQEFAGWATMAMLLGVIALIYWFILLARPVTES